MKIEKVQFENLINTHRKLNDMSMQKIKDPRDAVPDERYNEVAIEDEYFSPISDENKSSMETYLDLT